MIAKNGGGDRPQTLTPEVRALIGEAQKNIRDEIFEEICCWDSSGCLGSFLVGGSRNLVRS